MKILSQNLKENPNYKFEFYDIDETEFNCSPEEFRDLFLVEDEDE